MTLVSKTEEILFEVMTPLDFSVRVTVTYWDLIVTINPPVMAGLEKDVKETLETQSRLESVEVILKSSYSIEYSAQDVGFVLSQKGSMMRGFLSQLTQPMQ